MQIHVALPSVGGLGEHVTCQMFDGYLDDLFYLILWIAASPAHTVGPNLDNRYII